MLSEGRNCAVGDTVFLLRRGEFERWAIHYCVVGKERNLAVGDTVLCVERVGI